MAKLPTDLWMTSEDLLTSAVFGTLKNLQSSITVDLFEKIHLLDGSNTPSMSPPLAWQFWPFGDTCEPDVVVSDDNNVCVIEAKLFSDFGWDVEVGNQLRREWMDGLRRAKDPKRTLWLIAITNHATSPKDSIRAQLKGCDADPTRVGWISWSEIGRFLMDLPTADAAGWREDLLELLAGWGLAHSAALVTRWR